jgi:peroxiredoxin
VSEDRFEDLKGDGRSVGERLAERDRTHPEPDRPRRPEVPRASNKYAWAVGIVMVMGLGVLLFTTTLPNTGAGLEGPPAGTRLRAFAAPSARGPLEGEANVCQRRPCAKQSGPVPACEVKGRDVVNLCELRRQPLVLTFVFDRGADCLPQVDRTERVIGEVGGVRFATVFFSRKGRDELRNIVERRRWRQPVAVDRDGAVANLYGVGGCPTTIFAKTGGKVDHTKLGNLTEQELRRGAERLTGR